MRQYQKDEQFSPNTLIEVDSVTVVPKTLMPPATLTVHVYSPPSSLSTSDIVRLLVYVNPKPDSVTERGSPLLILGPPHDSKTDPSTSTCGSRVATQVRVTEESIITVLGVLEEMVTVGLGTIKKEKIYSNFLNRKRGFDVTALGLN